MNNNFKYFLLIVISFVFVAGYSQMSVFNKIDTFKGLMTKVIPSGNNMILFSTPQDASDTVKFRMTRLDECRDIDWVKDYVVKDVAGVSKLDAITVQTSEKVNVYLLLKSPFYRLTLIKMDKNGVIDWTKTIHSEDGDSIFSATSNIMVNESNNVLYIVSGDKSDNTVIFSLDLDGEVLHSKIIKDFKHKSSVINGSGDLTMFGESNRYLSVDLDDEFIDTVLWSKKLSGGFIFDELNDPVAVAGLGDTSVIIGVVDTLTKQDTAIYRLTKFDKNGDVFMETKGFYADNAEFYSNNSLKFMESDVKFPKTIYYMINNKVFFFNTNLVKLLNPKIYKFNDRIKYQVFSTSLEICDDESLVMSGFCYKEKENGEIDPESPYVFISKTQPSDKQFVVEAETKNCLADSTAKEMIEVEKLIVKEDTLQMDTIELILEEKNSRFKIVEGFNEEKCGKINMDEKHDSIQLCPGQNYPFDAPSLKCSGEKYSWNTGSTESSIIVNEEGEYKVTVTFCDSVKVSTFVYKYTDDPDDCFKVYYPNAFFPSGRDTLNTIFKMAIDTDYKKESEYKFTVFNMKIFDRWGEKVFETTDPEEGWDGTFRGKEMTPGVYLYDINWKVDVLGVKIFEGDKSGQIMLFR